MCICWQEKNKTGSLEKLKVFSNLQTDGSMLVLNAIKIKKALMKRVSVLTFYREGFDGILF